ncbi:MAG TPA: hemolysin family protein [Dehalococcoidia bacterium]|nr:hemolysin family protein [Dehalococcoidia bacterium]
MSGFYGDLLKLLVVVLVELVHAYFVASEYSLVTLRKSRMVKLVEEGNRSARLVLDTLNDIQELIAAVQLGVTMTSLALGALAEPTIATMLEPAFDFVPRGWAPVTAHAIALIITFALITALDIVAGELVPKTVALQSSERVALAVIRPMRLFIAVFRPFIALLNAAGSAVLRAAGFRPAGDGTEAHSPEELKIIVAASTRAGVLDAEEQEMLFGVLEFSALSARQVMVPRTEVVGLPVEAGRDAVYEAVRRTRHTKYPVYRRTIDDIIGILYVRDMLGAWLAGNEDVFDLRRLMRRPLFVPDSMHIDQLLAAMKRAEVHIAVVFDEFGGTAGIVAMEDILERIVGEVRDEFEVIAPDIVELPNGEAEIDGTVLVTDVNERFGLKLDEDEADTIGGLIFFNLGREPHEGDLFAGDGFELRVEKVDRRRIDRVRLLRRPGSAAAGAP